MSSKHASFVQGIVQRVFLAGSPLRMFERIMKVYTNLIELYRADESVYEAYQAKAEKLKEKYEAFISGQSATLEEQLEEAVQTRQNKIRKMRDQLTVKVEKIRKAEAELQRVRTVEAKRSRDSRVQESDEKDEMPPSSVKMVLWDMDRTLLKFYTMGLYEGSIADLVQHVTPSFLRLVPQLVSNDIKVGVVTFNDPERAREKDLLGGADLVGPLLGMAFDKYFNDKGFRNGSSMAVNLVGKIFIVGAYPNYRNQKNSGLNMPLSKKWHIDQVIKESGPKKTEYHEIMFFDDEEKNVEAARNDGIISVHVNGATAFTMQDWQKGIRLVKQRDMSAKRDEGDSESDESDSESDESDSGSDGGRDV